MLRGEPGWRRRVPSRVFLQVETVAFLTRIVLKRLRDERISVFCYDPGSGKTVNTGLTARNRSELDRHVRALKQSLERAGNRVEVVEA